LHITASGFPKHTLFQAKAGGIYTPVVYSGLEYYYRVRNESGHVFYATALLELKKKLIYVQKYTGSNHVTAFKAMLMITDYLTNKLFIK